MSTLLTKLAEWAVELSLEEISPRIGERVRLQHLNLAATVRRHSAHPLTRALRAGGSGRGSVFVVGGRTGTRRDAVRIHAGLGGWLNQSDHILWASTGPGAVPVTWAYGKGRTVGDLVRATVAANEIGGRLGASTIIGGVNGSSEAATTALCAAVAAGVLEGLTVEQLAHAMALSLVAPGRSPSRFRSVGGESGALLTANPAVMGLEAVAMASAGMKGSTDILEGQDGLLETLCRIPLRSAFTGLGNAWLSDTIGYKLSPVPLTGTVPVQSVREILARHLKAAGRRLRPDQVERVEIHTCLPVYARERSAAGGGASNPASVTASAKMAIATMLVGHGLGAEQLDETWLSSEEARIRSLAARVEFRHSWDHSVQWISHLLESTAPLFAGLTMAEIGALFGEYGQMDLPKPSALKDRWTVLKSRPNRLLETIRYSSGDLTDVNWSDWQLRLPTQVKLYTTRGGNWPEKRAVPEGSPGWPWEKTVEAVIGRFGMDDDALRSRAIRLSEADMGSDAEDWVQDLLDDKET